MHVHTKKKFLKIEIIWNLCLDSSKARNDVKLCSIGRLVKNRGGVQASDFYLLSFVSIFRPLLSIFSQCRWNIFSMLLKVKLMDFLYLQFLILESHVPLGSFILPKSLALFPYSTHYFNNKCYNKCKIFCLAFFDSNNLNFGYFYDKDNKIQNSQTNKT